MFERLGSLAYRLRYLILVAWVIVAAAALVLAPSLAKEGSTDQSSFLPPTAESVLARNALEKAFPREVAASTATVAFTRQSGLTSADRAHIGQVAGWITGSSSPADLSTVVASVDTPESNPEMASMMRSPDGTLELMNVNLKVASMAGGAGNAVDALRSHLASTAPSGLQANVTGSAGISVDYLDAIVKGTDSTTIVTVVLVLVILLLIYRAPLAALVPLVTIGAAFLVSRGVLGMLAAAGWKISSLLDTFVVVIVFGVGTDYTIFLISRFREEVAGRDWHTASQATVKRIGAVITASAATVIVGLGSMIFGSFGMIQTTGPALAVAVFVTLLAGLTLAPALLAIFGHYLFWPAHEKADAAADPTGFFARLAGAVSRRPVLVTVVLLAALLVPVAHVPAMRTNFDVLTDLPTTSDARQGFDQVAAHLGKGKIMPSTGVVEAGQGVDLLAPASLERLRDVTQALVKTNGVQSATSVIAPTGDGSVPAAFVPSKHLDTMATGFASPGSSGGSASGASSGSSGSSGASSGASSGSAGSSGSSSSGSSAATDPAALLEPSVTGGLESATAYVKALGPAFPSIASTPAYTAALDDLQTAPGLIAQLRQGARVSTQLRQLSAALKSPTSRAGDTQSLQSFAGYVRDVAGYLQELAAAYPSTASQPAFQQARADLVALQQAQASGVQPSPATIVDLSARLDALATHFDSQPEAILFPKSLPQTPQAAALERQISTTFGKLPGDLRSLAAKYAALPDDVFIPTGLTGSAGQQVNSTLAAFMSANRDVTRLYVITSDDPYSTAAFDTVRRARTVVDPIGSQLGHGTVAYVGGPTAELADTQTALGKDFQRVALITVLGVLLVLVVLLRALVAPVYLVLTVLLSYLSTLGLSAWLFQSVLGQPGVNYFLPLMVFVLLVALGSDYNIFLMSRVREESEEHPIREGIRLASGRTGAVITSAGLILAGTFGSMASAPLVVLFQVGVAVAVGVLIDTFLVRSILVPALTTVVGDRAWWPSRLGVRRSATGASGGGAGKGAGVGQDAGAGKGADARQGGGPAKDASAGTSTGTGPVAAKQAG